MKSFVSRLMVVALAALAISACSTKEEDKPSVPVMKPKITGFAFSADKNPGLQGRSFNAEISNGIITVVLPGVDPQTPLVADISGTYKVVQVDGEKITPGVSSFVYEDGSQITVFGYTSQQTKTYTLKIAFTEIIPKVEIFADAPITSKEEYVNARYRFSGYPDTEDIEIDGKIKGRGNSTFWCYPKKPYKIKLSEKTPVFGMKKSKNWVLLAEYCDKSLLRTTYLFTMGRFLKMPWTPASIHVNVYLNGEYIGIYFLTEQVDSGSNKVPCENGGFLIQDDNYYNLEPLYMHTPYGKHFTFKYPDPEDGGIVYGDENWNWLYGFLTSMESALKSSNFYNPDNGVYKYLDIETFAKWYIAQEVLANLDTNLYYAILDKNSKLQAYPLWDGEWMLGYSSPGPNGWQLYPEKPLFQVTDPAYRNCTYYEYLFKDHNFVKEVYNQWQIIKAQMPQIKATIAAEAELLSIPQIDNFKRWPILNTIVSVELVKFETWEEEVDYAANWFDRRVAWFDSFITKEYNS